MRALVNFGGIRDNAVNIIKSPVTEMICAFIIDMSRNYIFAFIHQFSGDHLIYTILQISFLFIPWIMLGHGAFRYESQKKSKVYPDSNNNNSSSTMIPKKNLLLSSFLLAAFIIVRFLPFS